MFSWLIRRVHMFMDNGQKTRTKRKPAYPTSVEQANDHTLSASESTSQPANHGDKEAVVINDKATKVTAIPEDEQGIVDTKGKKLAPINSFLRSILWQDRDAISQFAHTLSVTENTVYRWINGTSIPQPTHLKRLPDVLPLHRNKLLILLKQHYPGSLESNTLEGREVQKDIYQRIISIVATNDEEDLLLWNVQQTLFDHILLQLDPEFHGLAVTYARLTAQHEDGTIHSLREVEMRGHAPWPHTSITQVFLGSNTLAGRAAMYQRQQTWEDTDENRTPALIDEFERSACAFPLLRGRTIAGVLIVSSNQPDFFRDPTRCQMVEEYAKLLAVAIPAHFFHSIYSLRLHSMPPLPFQRTRLSETYVKLIHTYMLEQQTTRAAAEAWAEIEMEREFEAQSGE